MPQLSLMTPLGEITVSEENGAVVSLDWGRGRDQDETPLLRQARSQLHAYFDGDLLGFDLPLAPQGTPFRQRVWAVMTSIPPGETLTYGAVAERLGSSARAVGQACGDNPIPIVIPCHRITGGGGSIGGYSGGDGPATKRVLLALESAAINKGTSPR